MNKTKIVMTRKLLPIDQKYISRGLINIVGDTFELIEPPEYDEEGICQVIENADVILGPYVTSTILKKARKLKLIQVPWTGMDTFNFAAVEGFSVPICNTHSNADSVAELGITLVLDLLKKVSYHDRKMRNGDWNRGQKPLNLQSKILSKQTFCILGCGNIGYRMAKLLHAFKATVIAVDDNKSEYNITDNFFLKIFPSNAIIEALKISNVVICALPLTDSTQQLIDQELILNMKDGTFLVNMSRAEIIEEDAVYQALLSGKLAGFASDVWWNAPKRGESKSYPSKYNEFWKMDNVVMSPHRAGFAEGELPHLDEAIINIANLILGKELINVVDTKKHY